MTHFLNPAIARLFTSSFLSLNVCLLKQSKNSELTLEHSLGALGNQGETRIGSEFDVAFVVIFFFNSVRVCVVGWLIDTRWLVGMFNC